MAHVGPVPFPIAPDGHDRDMVLAAFTLADGAWVFGAVMLIWLLSIAYSYYTRRGSAINQRPHAGVYSAAPGAKTPSVLGHDDSAAQRLIGRRVPVPPEERAEAREEAAPGRRD
jgi:hypothetical protein